MTIQAMETIAEKPYNTKLFFENFVPIFTKKYMIINDTHLQIVESGPRVNNSTIFNLIPTGDYNIEIKVNIVENSLDLAVYYELN